MQTITILDWRDQQPFTPTATPQGPGFQGPVFQGTALLIAAPPPNPPLAAYTAQIHSAIHGQPQSHLMAAVAGVVTGGGLALHFLFSAAHMSHQITGGSSYRDVYLVIGGVTGDGAPVTLGQYRVRLTRTALTLSQSPPPPETWQSTLAPYLTAWLNSHSGGGGGLTQAEVTTMISASAAAQTTVTVALTARVNTLESVPVGPSMAQVTGMITTSQSTQESQWAASQQNQDAITTALTARISAAEESLTILDMEQDLKAPLVSPALVGIPTCPTGNLDGLNTHPAQVVNFAALNDWVENVVSPEVTARMVADDALTGQIAALAALVPPGSAPGEILLWSLPGGSPNVWQPVQLSTALIVAFSAGVGDVLTFNGSSWSAQQPNSTGLPGGNYGDVLTFNGSSWSAQQPNSTGLPGGNYGDVLTFNGYSWVAQQPMSLPTGNPGDFLSWYNGNWASVPIPPGTLVGPQNLTDILVSFGSGGWGPATPNGDLSHNGNGYFTVTGVNNQLFDLSNPQPLSTIRYDQGAWRARPLWFYAFQIDSDITMNAEDVISWDSYTSSPAAPDPWGSLMADHMNFQVPENEIWQFHLAVMIDGISNGGSFGLIHGNASPPTGYHDRTSVLAGDTAWPVGVTGQAIIMGPATYQAVITCNDFSPTLLKGQCRLYAQRIA
jgi:hypothetical protein